MRVRGKRFLLLVLTTICSTATIRQSNAQDQYATISECAVTLVGEFDELTHIKAESSAGLLIQDTLTVDGVGTIALTTPFNVGSAIFDDGNGRSIGFGNQDHFGTRHSGNIPTALLYTGTQEMAANGDLTVSFQLSDQGELSTLPFVPGEPNTACAELQSVTPNFGGLTAILGGVAADEQFVTVVDHTIVLNGTFPQLAGIQVSSENGGLSQRWLELPNGGGIPLTAPFPAGNVVQNSPERMVIGVLGARNRIDIQQSVVETAFHYTGTQEDAEIHLTVEMGLGDDSPKSIPIGGEVGSADGTFDVDDGVITLVGDFSRLSGIEATSQGGFLSFADELTEPFAADAAVLLDESDGKNILLGVNTAAHRVDLEGITQTAIRYSASDAVALTDLTIRLGIAGQGAIEIQHMEAAVPEPDSGAAALLMSLALLGWGRGRR